MRSRVSLLLLLVFAFTTQAGHRPPHYKAKEAFRNAKIQKYAPKESTSPVQPSAMPEYRLPTSLSPTHQLIQLQPYLYVGNFTFDGYTEITFDCLTATSNITIHHRDLTIDDTLTTVEEVGGGTSVGIVSQTYDADKEFYIIDLDQDLAAGQSYILSITYVGPVNDVTSYGPGCFEARYVDQGTDVYYFVSDFEPHDARACFPSFDEPSFKANFTTRLIREDDMISASNGPLLSSTPLGNGWTVDEFQTTVIMSTYLNTFHISDFPNRSTNSSNGIIFAVYCRPGLENSTDYALFLGPNITEGFEARFNVPYAMPKQDQVALTEFNTGAMENWGFITYTDYYLLYAEEMSSATDRQLVCEVVSHELAHQWFGNLITTEWWPNLWLQEGFASYYEYVGCGDAEPEYEEDTIYMISELHYCLGIDDVQTSNPLVYDLDHPDEIRGMFNSITYAKGSAMTRMMQYFLTQPSFEAGLETYLKTFGFDNVVQDDLFDVLNTQAMQDGTLDPSLTVKEIMDTWTLQAGYPVVTVTRSDDGTATLTQERFYITVDPDIIDPNDYKWYIPITYTTQGAPNFDVFNEFWMTPNDAQLNISGLPSSSEWVIFNIQEGGYFRVNYDDTSWNTIITQLNDAHNVINVKNRAQIINDAFNLATAGIISYDYGFAAGEYLDSESHYVPVDTALDELGEIDALFRRDTSYGKLKNYLFGFVRPIYLNIGFQDSLSDPLLDQMMRDLVTSWACYLGDADCLADSSALYSQWMGDPDNHSIIGNNIRYTVYCAGVQQGSVLEWDFAYDRYLNSLFTFEQARLLSAMGCSEESWILSRYLDMAFNDTSGITQARTTAVVSAVSEGVVGEDVAWDYVRANDGDIAAYMGGSSSVANYVLIISRKFNTNARLQQLQDYRDEFIAEFGSGTEGPIDEAIENTEFNIGWMADNYDEIVNWLTNNGY